MSETEPEDVVRLAAALRADRGDLDVYVNVLASTLTEVFPAGAVEVERERSMRDRLAGRDGDVVAIRVATGDTVLELLPEPRGLRARLVKEVRGVVISRRDLTVAEWADLLASHLAASAQDTEAGRAALERLLGLG